MITHRFIRNRQKLANFAEIHKILCIAIKSLSDNAMIQLYTVRKLIVKFQKTFVQDFQNFAKITNFGH